MYKKGDIVKFTDYGMHGSNHVSHAYLYANCEKLSREFNFPIARNLSSISNEGEVLYATDTHAWVEYTDRTGYNGGLLFPNGVLEMIKPKESIINNYQIF